MMSGRFIRFLLTGEFAALINLGSRYVLNEFMSFEAAVAVAYLAGVVVAYVLAKIFVFDKSGAAVATEFQRFVMVNILSLAIIFVAFRSASRSMSFRPGVPLACGGGRAFHRRPIACGRRLLTHKHYTFRAEPGFRPRLSSLRLISTPGPGKGPDRARRRSRRHSEIGIMKRVASWAPGAMDSRWRVARCEAPGGCVRGRQGSRQGVGRVRLRGGLSLQPAAPLRLQGRSANVQHGKFRMAGRWSRWAPTSR